MAVFLSIVTCLVLIIPYTLAAHEYWDNEVFSGRQWNDYLTPTTVASSAVHTDAILLLFTSDCEEEYTSLGLTDGLRPPAEYLIFGRHDCKSAPELIWYDMDEKDRICDRYNFASMKCGTYLYFKKGSDINTPTELYHPSDNTLGVLAWMWSKLEVQLRIINNRAEAVHVSVQGRGPKVIPVTIEPGEKGVIDAFMSYCALVEGDGTFIHGKLLTAQMTIAVNDNISMGKISARNWFKKQDYAVQLKSRNKLHWRWGIAYIYLMDFKQPPLLPKFTELGYKKGMIPEQLYQDIIKYYHEKEAERKQEEHDVEPAINDSEVKCAMVFLDDDMKKYIGDAILPYMEEWVNMKLVQTRLYGVREYFRGNILRNHVDRISTHVVSVILQIDQELAGAPAWELEVITFDGQRHNVTMEPGEMVFYESSTLIHGRPFPFLGERFANAFLHYRPVENWPWGVSDDGQFLLKDGKPVVNMFYFNPLKEKRAPYRDEL